MIFSLRSSTLNSALNCATTTTVTTTTMREVIKTALHKLRISFTELHHYFHFFYFVFFCCFCRFFALSCVEKANSKNNNNKTVCWCCCCCCYYCRLLSCLLTLPLPLGYRLQQQQQQQSSGSRTTTKMFATGEFRLNSSESQKATRSARANSSLGDGGRWSGK